MPLLLLSCSAIACRPCQMAAFWPPTARPQVPSPPAHACCPSTIEQDCSSCHRRSCGGFRVGREVEQSHSFLQRARFCVRENHARAQKHCNIHSAQLRPPAHALVAPRVRHHGHRTRGSRRNRSGAALIRASACVCDAAVLRRCPGLLQLFIADFAP
jgi:hypothetical protein